MSNKNSLSRILHKKTKEELITDIRTLDVKVNVNRLRQMNTTQLQIKLNDLWLSKIM